ncbi:SprT-like family protein [Micromonospora sp. M71_S20]|uniref:hypothetical protein n=1 Tax=Micromonospora sp. M71_S20 TaxID=592872 RepID=UPI000EB376A4|nr:hypothetical protein [Micromonospora sp. M71_S20]RLK22675.1 SprT-like family protein [Micromonospora sp. M71_S20]
MTAAGKITAAALAARVAAGESARVLLVEAEEGFRPATRKTGVVTLAVTRAGARHVGPAWRAKRQYSFETSQGETVWVSPSQTFILAPEDAAAVKRAHAEALAEDALRTNRAEREAARRIAPDLMRRSGRPAPAVCNAEAAEEGPVAAPAKSFSTREEWLTEAVEALKPLFEGVGATVPTVRVSVGWPGGKGKKNSVIGQCWASWTAADKVSQVFISPVLDDAGQVLATLAHEVVHAVDDCKSGHKGDFAKIAKGIGLTGKMTATVAGDDLKVTLGEIAAFLGPYPHAKLSITDGGAGEKPQKNRQLKVECAACGYTARTTRKWLDEVGAPLCPCNREEMVIA